MIILGNMTAMVCCHIVVFTPSESCYIKRRHLNEFRWKIPFILQISQHVYNRNDVILWHHRDVTIVHYRPIFQHNLSVVSVYYSLTQPYQNRATLWLSAFAHITSLAEWTSSLSTEKKTLLLNDTSTGPAHIIIIKSLILTHIIY